MTPSSTTQRREIRRAAIRSRGEGHKEERRRLTAYQRTHQGYRLKGRTPAQALCEALGLEELPRFPQDGDEADTEIRKEGEAA
jgi:hypothetical protein